MKKRIWILISVLLVAVLTIAPVFASIDGGNAAVSDATGKSGETVTVMVSIDKFDKADAIGVKFSYDERLTLDAANSGWVLTQASMLNNFNATKKSAAWSANGAAEDLNGDILKLSFVLPEPEVGQTDFTYNVSCTVQLTSNGSDVGTQTVSGTITLSNPATELTLSTESLELDLSGTKIGAVTVASVTPENTTDRPSWVSSNPDVVSVENGVVTALKKGSAEITVTVGSLSKTCQVTVSCSHKLTEHKAKEPTCQEGGWNKYYTCDNCNDMFKADGVTETTVTAEQLPIVACTGGTATCTELAKCKWCGVGYGELAPHAWGTAWLTDDNNHWHKCDNCDEINASAPHDFKWVIDIPETALTEGEKHEECTVCEKTRNENTVIPHTHQMTYHAAVAATCNATGNVAYWTCASELCTGVYYADEACTGTIAVVETAINPSNHVGGTELRNPKTPTCVDPGYTGDTYCLGCTKMTEEGKSIDPTGNHAGGTATCTKQAVCDTCKQGYGDLLPHQWGTAWLSDGTNHWHKCDNCEATNASAAHDLQWVTDTPATEDSIGYKHKECTVCKYKTAEGTVIEKLDHVHIGITHHAAVAATCKLTGNVEYWTCSSPKCAGKYFGDDQCQLQLDTIIAPINPDNHKQTEIRGASTPSCYQTGYTGDTHCVDCNKLLKSGDVIPATERHTAGSAWVTDGENHWHVCTTTGCGAKVDIAAHTYTWIVDKPATEDDTGLKHEQCTCGVKRSEGTVIEKLDHVHIGIKHFAAVKATCVKAGTVEYWTCASSKCAGKYYGDAKCQLVLETIVEAVNAANHTGKTVLKDNKFATCSEAGYTGDTYCADCGVMVKKGVVISATGLHTAKEGYLTDGKQHWQVCVRCEAIIGNAKENHTYTWVIDKYPTEEAEGVKHQKCTVCAYETAKNTVIEKLEHKPVLVDGKASTCTEVGVKEHYLCGNCGRYYASVDGELGDQIEKSATVIEAVGHTYSTDWSSDQTDHWHACSCGDAADKQAHTIELVGAKEATETEAGYTGDQICSICGYEVAKGEEIPVLPPVTEPAATEPGVTEPTDTDSDTEAKESDNTVVIILIVAAAVVVCAVVAVIVIKKRKANA